jgi:hypothetical protein
LPMCVDLRAEHLRRPAGRRSTDDHHRCRWNVAVSGNPRVAANTNRRTAFMVSTSFAVQEQEPSQASCPANMPGGDPSRCIACQAIRAVSG